MDTSYSDRSVRDASATVEAPDNAGAPAEDISMRTWMDTLEDAGQLRRVSAKVDWDLEIAAIARVNIAKQGPGLVFNNIRDHESTTGTRFFTCGISNKTQIRLMLGLPEDATDKQVVRHLKDRYREPMPPVVVPSGPTKENIVKGDDIDLWQFPTVRWHESDGGRFIDTFCGVITQDPETRRDNIGLYRGQVLDRNKIGKLLVPTQGWGDHFMKYSERPSENAMPVAVAHGWHDVLPFCAGSPFPKSVCEWDMMGAILGQPVELVECETVPLRVPASTEIVVEGWIDPDPATWEMEGPFADYPGYLGGKPSPKPVLQVTAITHRNDPVLRGALEGARPGFPSEDSLLCCYSWSAIAWNVLQDAGVSGVTDVWMPPVSTGVNIIVQINKKYRGQAQQIGTALWGTSMGQWFFKNVIVVEEDIDIRDWESVEWAIAFRVNAGRDDVWLVGPTFGSPLDPSTFPEDRSVPEYGSGKWTRMLIDATRSWEHPRNPDWDNNRWPELNKINPELEAKVAARWVEYGITPDYLTDEQREMLTMVELKKRLKEV